ncbi:hypothetical protein GFS24_13865 [Chitinophaga sp. SYP-B3965]|uniref:hypothetical protein n=1 Tax=Chitinophaga sp. SYP-B3965 TaxID=2663120 RepID=UPI0012998D38|nr:hypothetical protein [Chitinophaga sp. SYP-B3965]MRG46204.1 hypothetical protein [Chitinophaga sp. SYP-B3965]
MYYLKCGYCAEHSALKSEYITFCDHCGKKFSSNYADWKLQHPNSTFAAYEIEVGVPEARYEAIMKKRNRQGFDLRKKAALITTVVVLIACSTVGAYYGPTLVKLFQEPVVPVAMLNTENWRTFRGNILQLQTPLSLSPVSVKDEPNIRLKAFKGGSTGEGLVIRMDEVVYLANNYIGLELASKEAANQLSRGEGISQFTYVEKNVVIMGQQAILQHGSYIYKQSSPIEFNSLIVVKGGTRVQLLVAHRGNDETGKKIAEKVMGSARLN